MLGGRTAGAGYAARVSTEVGAITARTAFVLLLATWPRRIVLGVILLVPMLVALLGGFGRAEPRSYDLAPGEWVDLGAYSARVESSFVSDEVLTLFLDDEVPDDAFFGVVLEMVNTERNAVSPQYDFGTFVPRLPEGVLGRTSGPDYAMLVSDGSLGAPLMPGLTTRVAMLWTVPDVTQLPDGDIAIDLTASELTYSLMGDEDRWLSLGDVWTVTPPRTAPPETLIDEEQTR
jgi:hypothetical protein